MATGMRDKWTDERLDDLNKKVDDGFARIDQRFAHLDARIDGLQKTMWQGFAWLVGLQVTFFVATIGFIAVQT
ncbi:MAG: hypothetical protein AB7T48_14275 [Solirubrobacterales bacterium]